ncbi:ribonuclease P protein component [Parapedobacter soli]|uniref:ribonuclease P protein component n=1 Tax=Parapedobacter soli TaxID=416955 RepID=UPI0021CA66DE|nr:ribonuclease P protein component [Parapedobacter soli]
MKRNTFSKEERLCSKRLIDGLFRDGSSFFIYPYRVVFMRMEGVPTAQVLLSVSKRRFSRAVDRNLLKRRMREAYRLQKNELLYPVIEGKPYGLVVAIQYVADKLLDFPLMYQKMAAVLKRMHDEAL